MFWFFCLIFCCCFFSGASYKVIDFLSCLLNLDSHSCGACFRYCLLQHASVNWLIAGNLHEICVMSEKSHFQLPEHLQDIR